MAPALHLALALLFFPTVILSDSLHVPLTHRRQTKSIRNWADEANRLRRKYGYQTVTSESRHLNSRAIVGISMLDQGFDYSYIANVTIGTPPQSFEVVLDGASGDFWLSGSNCPTCPAGSPIFDPSTSSTFVNGTPTTSSSDAEITIVYGGGDVRGTVGSDIVAMGGFLVPSQTFLSVDAMASGIGVNAPVSGLMGLGFEALSSTGATPFWQAITNANLLNSPEMSFWLARELNPESETSLAYGGVFTLGGTNSTLFSGDIEYHNLVSTPSYWQLSLSSLTVNGKAVTLSSTNALSSIDIGNDFILGPQDDVVSLYNSIPGSVSMGSSLPGFYAYPCSTSITVALAFGGQSWPINPEDFNAGSVSNGNPLCLGAIVVFSLDNTSDSNSPTWIIGTTFLKNVYTVFRSSPASVGFAQLSTAAGGSSTVGPSFASSTAGAGASSTSAASTPTSAASSTPTATSKGSDVGTIVGGVVGGIAIIAAAGCLIAFIFMRNRKQSEPTPSTNTASRMSGADHL